jgi:hypothetical protein
MERRQFTREFKLEAVRLIKDRGVGSGGDRSRAGLGRCVGYKAGRRRERGNLAHRAFGHLAFDRGGAIDALLAQANTERIPAKKLKR